MRVSVSFMPEQSRVIRALVLGLPHPAGKRPRGDGPASHASLADHRLAGGVTVVDGEGVVAKPGSRTRATHDYVRLRTDSPTGRWKGTTPSPTRRDLVPRAIPYFPLAVPPRLRTNTCSRLFRQRTRDGAPAPISQQQIQPVQVAAHRGSWTNPIASPPRFPAHQVGLIRQ